MFDDDDDDFELDAHAQPVLVGLTRSEMLEFIRLDELINANRPIFGYLTRRMA